MAAEPAPTSAARSMLDVPRLRTSWADLPALVREAVEDRIGAVHRAEVVEAGLISGISAVLHSDTMSMFLKGLPSDHRRIATLEREAAIAEHVLEVGARLHWEIGVGGWLVLGFEYLRGRHADYSPGSADLDEVAELLSRLGHVDVQARDLMRVERRWAVYASEGDDLSLLAGSRLLHTDLNPLNVLITGAGVRLVDWAWPAAGAGWVDVACAALWLIAEGHTPAAAESWAAQVPPWSEVTPAGLATFVAVNRRMWLDVAPADVDAWEHQMRLAAATWAAYRQAVAGL